MNHVPGTARGGRNHNSGASTKNQHRLRAALAALAATLMLSGCGGGGYADSGGNFNVGISVGGVFVSDRPVGWGNSTDLVIHAGESFVLDAGEPVYWTLYVGGSAVSGGARVYYAGVDITATTLDSYSVAVDTYAAFRLDTPVPITLVATSTYDSAQVATVNVLITD